MTPSAEKRIDLFILSGQSNMNRLRPERTFIPTLKDQLPGDEIIVVKEAQGAVPIRLWLKDWEPAPGVPVVDNHRVIWGEIYDRMMSKVYAAMRDRRPDTITFVWMQGERDAREGHGQVYAASLRKLIDQLRSDLKRADVNVVIGRLSDFSVGNKIYTHWDEVRLAQEQVADEDNRAAWVDTDAWNGDDNALHYTADGYDKLGRAFAQKAVELLEAHSTFP